MSETTAPAVVKSVGRALAVLEMCVRAHRPLTAGDISRQLRYPKSSTSALMKSLVTLGYLSFDEHTLTYSPAAPLARLGEGASWALSGPQCTRRLLEELRDSTGETITLSMQNGLRMQLLNVIPGSFSISLRVEQGTSLPLVGTSVGTALLSALPMSNVRELIRRANRLARPREKRRSAAELLGEVVIAKRRGFAVAYDRVEPDVGAVAMPLVLEPDRAPLVVAVGGLAERVRRRESAIVKTLVTALTTHFPESRALAVRALAGRYGASNPSSRAM